MLSIRYTCGLCGLFDVEAQVRFRESSEDVVDWMKKVVEPGLVADHQKRSPTCRPETLQQIKIPVPPGKDGFIGGPTHQ